MNMKRYHYSFVSAVSVLLAGLMTIVFVVPAQAVCKKKTSGYFKILRSAGGAGGIAIGLAPAFSNAGNVQQINRSLTGRPGNAQRGRAVLLDRKKGNCLACHRINSLTQEPFHGEVGPRLSSVGRKYTDGQLRQFVVDSRVFNPRTLMPAYYIRTGLKRVSKKHRGKTILTAQEVEDLVAYMKTLRD